MNYEQLLSAAAASCGDLGQKDRIKVFLASAPDDSSAENIFKTIQAEIAEKGIHATAIRAGSLGYCNLEPIIMFDKQDKSIAPYFNITAEKIPALIDDFRKDSPDPPKLPHSNLQNRIALRNCGYMNPASLAHYILLRQGYTGLRKALLMEPEEAIDYVRKSGLRGRGGAGYTAADIWTACRDTGNDGKYLLCNAVEADPRARTARLLMESDPHAVLEGMLIAAHAVGASKGIVCINADYAAAIENLENILGKMKRSSLLGTGILDSPFSFEMNIKKIPAALVSGEESALLRCLEERQPMPYLRPPYPAVRGFADKPTLIHNPETFSNISAIFQKNPEWFAGFRMAKSSGTKVITLSGNGFPGITIEIPLGISMKGMIDNIACSFSKSRHLKAVQFGGPTGFFFSADSLDTPIDYEVAGHDFMMGSGTIRIFDSDSCGVDMVRETVSYIQQQSCGQCVFCREGSFQAVDILKDISENRGRSQDLDLLIELADAMKLGSICGLGKSASNPILSGIKLFRGEFDAHILEQRCPASERL